MNKAQKEHSIAVNVEDGTIYYVWKQDRLSIIYTTEDGTELVLHHGHDAKRMIRQCGLNREINRQDREERRRKRRKEKERRKRLKNGGDNNA